MIRSAGLSAAAVALLTIVAGHAQAQSITKVGASSLIPTSPCWLFKRQQPGGCKLRQASALVDGRQTVLYELASPSGTDLAWARLSGPGCQQIVQIRQAGRWQRGRWTCDREGLIVLTDAQKRELFKMPWGY